jgi:hypothetical protein
MRKFSHLGLSVLLQLNLTCRDIGFSRLTGSAFERLFLAVAGSAIVRKFCWLLARSFDGLAVVSSSLLESFSSSLVSVLLTPNSPVPAGMDIAAKLISMA